MKAEELMKGDWVTSEDLLNRPARYEGRYDDYIPLNGKPYRRLVCLWPGDKEGASVPEERVLPVPLTPEILEKNGFECRGAWCDPGEDIGLRQDGDTWGLLSYYFEYNALAFCHIKYVHELQHALRLCGIEKEIVL